ncbi:MAG: MCE family protein [Bacteroidales bacterium]|nr:MCE family protein [Bacteroidales bacterium]
MKFTREFKIGFVALVAIALAIWGLNYLKGINIFKSTDTYYGVYNNVKGLVENAVVYLNGYKVGNVSSIEFDKTNVSNITVKISLAQKIRLLKGTTMVLRSGSIISGTKDVDLVLGDGPGFHDSGDTLISSVQVELTDYIDPIRQKIESLITSVDTLMLALDDLMNKETRKNLQGTIANLNGATASLRLSLQPSGALNQSLSNLSLVTDNLRKSNEDISAMLRNFAAISDTLKQSRLKELIAHADSTFALTADLFTLINSGEGTAGQLVMNDSLYNSLNSALTSLDSLLIDLREHPKRYVHLSVFGKKDK